MESCLGHKQVTPSEIAGSHLGSQLVQILGSQVGLAGSHTDKWRLLGGIGGILRGTKLGSRVGLAGSYLGLEAESHAGLTGFCLECSRDPGWDWRDPTWDSRRDPMPDVPKSRSGSQVELAGSRLTFFSGLANQKRVDHWYVHVVGGSFF